LLRTSFIEKRRGLKKTGKMSIIEGLFLKRENLSPSLFQKRGGSRG